MRKLLFLILVTWNCLLGQNLEIDIFKSLSNEPQTGLTNTAYRHVGDSITRSVRLSCKGGFIDSLTITSIIEPELSLKELFNLGNPITYTPTISGYVITISGFQIDSLISDSLSTIPNNFNGQLDPGEVLEFSERSRVISCSTGDGNF